MRPITSLFLLLVSFQSISQTHTKYVTLTGIITIQNSKVSTGTIIPVPGIQIKVGSSTSTGTNSNGYFSLKIINKTPGQTIVLTVTDPAQELELVNTDALAVRLPSEDESEIPLKLYMCKKGQREQNFMALYNINYEKLILARDEEIRVLKLKGLYTTEKISELEIKNAKLIEQTRELAESFASINRDDASEMLVEAFGYFEKGNIAKAIETLDFEKIQSGIDDSKMEMQLAKEQLEKNIQAMLRRADLLVLSGNDSEAEKAYEAAVDADTLNGRNLVHFANFLLRGNQYTKALKNYELGERYANNDEVKASALIGKGQIRIKMNDFEKASAYFKQAQEIYLITGEPAGLINVFASIGVLYTKARKFEEALDFSNKAVNLFEEFENQDIVITGVIAEILTNMGVIYKEQGSWSTSVLLYSKAIEMQRRCMSEYPELFEGQLAVTLSNLSNAYLVGNKNDKAIVAGEEALLIRRKMVKKNPEAHEPRLTESLNSLVGVYGNLNRLDEAEKIAIEANEILSRLAKQYPEIYDSELAKAMSNLGLVYARKNDLVKAENMLLAALKIRRVLSEENKIHEDVLASSLYKLGMLYVTKQDNKKAQMFLKECIEVAEKILKTDQSYNHQYIIYRNSYCDFILENNFSSTKCRD